MEQTGHHGPRYSLFGSMGEEDMLIKAQSLKIFSATPLMAENGRSFDHAPGMLKLMHKMEGVDSRIGDMNR